MEQQEQSILESFLEENKVRRRALLPLWMKIFIWIFMITGAIVPLAIIVAAVTGAGFQVSLYGLESNNPLSVVGMTVSLMFFLKGITAYGLWTEKDWAISLGTADAIIGIVACTFVMFIYPIIDGRPGFGMNLRLELVALIPYLLKLQKIKPQWEANGGGISGNSIL